MFFGIEVLGLYGNVKDSCCLKSDITFFVCLWLKCFKLILLILCEVVGSIILSFV